MVLHNVINRKVSRGTIGVRALYGSCVLDFQFGRDQISMDNPIRSGAMERFRQFGCAEHLRNALQVVSHCRDPKLDASTG